MGEENAVPKDWLATFFVITTRELRRLKAVIVKQGIPIGSTKKGYFYSSCEYEDKVMESEYNARIAKCSKMAKAYRGIRKNRNQKQLKGVK